MEVLQVNMQSRVNWDEENVSRPYKLVVNDINQIVTYFFNLRLVSFKFVLKKKLLFFERVSENKNIFQNLKLTMFGLGNKPPLD